jgi:hypothetical protein
VLGLARATMGYAYVEVVEVVWNSAVGREIVEEAGDAANIFEAGKV